MTKQRTHFFGNLPQNSPSKIGENKPVPQRRFNPLSPDDLELRFSSPAVSSCGGIPLWHAFLQRFGLPRLLEAYLRMDRGPSAFTPSELSRFFLDTRILGAARLQHLDAFRQDPLLTHLYGLDTLPSDETEGRYFKAFSPQQLRDLEALNERTILVGWKHLQRRRPGLVSRGVILDFDSTTFPSYGRKEGADRGRSFRHKDHPGFQPKFAFIGGLGLLLHQDLQPQSSNLGSDFESFERHTRAKLPPGARLWAIRGDGALYSEDRLARWEKEHLVYAVSAHRTSHLMQAIDSIPDNAWTEELDPDGHYCSLAHLTYKPKSWQKPRTFIISRRLKHLKDPVLFKQLEYDHFAYVTNYRRPLEEQFKFCVERCSLENQIKEAKNGLHYGALPHAEDHANRAFLAHVQLAFNLFIFWKAVEAPPEVNRWTIDTFRARILNVPANLIRRAGRWLVSLPVRWPWQITFRQLAAAPT